MSRFYTNKELNKLIQYHSRLANSYQVPNSYDPKYMCSSNINKIDCTLRNVLQKIINAGSHN